MVDLVVLERIAARRAELDELEEHLVKQLDEVRAERNELAVAERVLTRMSEQIAEERAAVAPATAQVGGRAVLLVPHCGDSVDEAALPGDYRKILAIVRAAGGPVQVRTLGEELGLEVEVRGKLEPLRAKLVTLARSGDGVVLLDGSLIRTRRRTGTENRKNYSGKHKCHGLLVIALTDDKGRLARVSAVRPGRTSEITACRHDNLTAHLRAAGLGAIAGLGFVGLDDSAPDTDPAVITGYKAARNRPLTRGQKLSNKALAAVRAPVEHGFAHLKNWRVLGKVRTDPKWATALVRALLVLTNREVAR